MFINGTFGWPGATAANMAAGGPGYPLTSLGVRVRYAPTDNLTILAAVFNGSPADPFAEDPQADNRYGTEFRLQDPPLLMVEGQFKYRPAACLAQLSSAAGSSSITMRLNF